MTSHDLPTFQAPAAGSASVMELKIPGGASSMGLVFARDPRLVDLEKEICAVQARVAELERREAQRHAGAQATETFANALAMKLATAGERAFVEYSSRPPKVWVVLEGFDADREGAIYQHQVDLERVLGADCDLEILHIAEGSSFGVPADWVEPAVALASRGHV